MQIQKNKIFTALYLGLAVIAASSSSFAVFGAALISAAVIYPKGFLKTAKFAFFAVLFFSSFAVIGGMLGSLIANVPYEPQKGVVLFCRSFCITLLTLCFFRRFGVVAIFGANGRLTLFFAVLVAKIESFTKEREDFAAAARSRGLKVYRFSDSVRVLSYMSSALLLKGLASVSATSEAMRSRGNFVD